MSSGRLRVELLLIICLLCSSYLYGEYHPIGSDSDYRENQDNEVRTDIGSELIEVDADAQVREKRGVIVCKIPGTGPCHDDDECCSDFCVNYVCCLHKNTCDMSSVSAGSIEGSKERGESQSRAGSHRCNCKEILVSSIGSAARDFRNKGVLGVYRQFRNYNYKPGFQQKKGSNYMFYKAGVGFVITNFWREHHQDRPVRAYIWNKKGGDEKCPYRITQDYQWKYSTSLRTPARDQPWLADDTLVVRCIGAPKTGYYYPPRYRR